MAKVKLPIDIKKLLESVSVIGQERDLPVFVDIVYDASASDEFIHYISAAFKTSDKNAIVEEHVLGDEVPRVSAPADMRLVVAARSELSGAAAEQARGVGVPSVVVAERGGVSFMGKDDAQAPFGGAQLACVSGIPSEDFIEVDLHDKSGRPLEELGVWIVANVPQKRLSMAVDFEFLRHPLSGELAISCAIQNGAIGTVFFVPGADMPLITLNQAKLVLEIASVYGNALDKGRLKELAAVVAGAYGLRGLARNIARQLPGPLGIPVKASVAFSGTLAMGYAAIDYFEEGGVVSGAVENAKALYAAVDKYARAAISRASGLAKFVQGRK